MLFTSLFINSVILFNFGMEWNFPGRSRLRYPQTHGDVYSLVFQCLHETIHAPNLPHPQLFPSTHHAADPMGLHHQNVSMQSSFAQISACDNFSFLPLMNQIPSPGNGSKFSSALWSLLQLPVYSLISPFLCTNFYCSTYHHVVKICLFLLWTVNPWGSMFVKNKVKQRRVTVTDTFLAFARHQAHMLAQLSP